MENRNDSELSIKEANKIVDETLRELAARLEVKMTKAKEELLPKIPDKAQEILEENLKKLEELKAKSQKPLTSADSKKIETNLEKIKERLAKNIEEEFKTDKARFESLALKKKEQMAAVIDALAANQLLTRGTLNFLLESGDQEHYNTIILNLADNKLLTRENLHRLFTTRDEVKHNIFLLIEAKTFTKDRLLSQDVLDGMFDNPKWATNIGIALDALIKTTQKDYKENNAHKDSDENVLTEKNIKLIIQYAEEDFDFGPLIAKIQDYLSFNQLVEERPDKIPLIAKNAAEIHRAISQIEYNYPSTEKLNKEEIKDIYDQMCEEISQAVIGREALFNAWKERRYHSWPDEQETHKFFTEPKSQTGERDGKKEINPPTKSGPSKSSQP